MRICAQEKNIEFCASCKEYPCEKFNGLLEVYPILHNDNALLQREGVGEWAKMQDIRIANKFSYTD